MPERIQRKRVKGWKMPPNTVYVGRGSIFGNPYRVVQYGKFVDDGAPAWAGRHEYELNYPSHRSREEAAQRAVDGFRKWLLSGSTSENCRRVRDGLSQLRGKNLACWCALNQTCHADVLLEIANRDSK